MSKRRPGRTSGRTKPKKGPRSPLTPSFHELANILGMRHFGVAKRVPKSTSACDVDTKNGKLLKNHQPLDGLAPAAIHVKYPDEVSWSQDRPGSRSIIRLPVEFAEDEELYLYINVMKGEGLPEFRINGAPVAPMGEDREGHFLPLDKRVVSTRENPVSTAVFVGNAIVSLIRVYVDEKEDGWLEYCVDCTAITSSQELPALQQGKARTT